MADSAAEDKAVELARDVLDTDMGGETTRLLAQAVLDMRERITIFKDARDLYFKAWKAERAQVTTLRKALEAVAQIQREKCEMADAETLFMVLDNKIDIANAALSAAKEGE